MASVALRDYKLQELKLPVLMCMMVVCWSDSGHCQLTSQQNKDSIASSKSMEAASLIETYLLGIDSPGRFDVAITISKLLDFGKEGVGEEDERIRWRHDKIRRKSLFARESISSRSLTKIPEQKHRKLMVYMNTNGKTHCHYLPHAVHRLGSGTFENFRKSADAPLFTLTGVIPFTRMSFLSRECHFLLFT